MAQAVDQAAGVSTFPGHRRLDTDPNPHQVLDQKKCTGQQFNGEEYVAIGGGIGWDRLQNNRDQINGDYPNDDGTDRHRGWVVPVKVL